MTDSVRIHVRVIVSQDVLANILEALGNHPQIKVVGDSDIIRGIGSLQVWPTDLLYLDSKWINYIYGAIRGRLHNLPIIVLADGYIADIVERWLQNPQRIIRTDNPLNPLLEPGIIFKRTSQIIENPQLEISEIIKRHSPLHRLAAFYSENHWRGYWEQIYGNVWINPDAKNQVRQQLAILSYEYTDVSIWVNVGGGSGAGKTHWELATRDFIRQQCESALATGMIDAELRSAYKNVQLFLVPPISTTRPPRPNENPESREWLAELPAEDFLFTVTRQEQGRGYQNGIRTSHFLRCLDEFVIINRILKQGGKLLSWLPMLPVMTFLRFPLPQRIRLELAPRSSTYPSYMSLALTTPHYDDPANQTAKYLQRLTRRWQGGIPSDHWHPQEIAGESYRLTMEVAPPLKFYDELIVIPEGANYQYYLRKLFRCLRRHGRTKEDKPPQGC